MRRATPKRFDECDFARTWNEVAVAYTARTGEAIDPRIVRRIGLTAVEKVRTRMVELMTQERVGIVPGSPESDA